MTAGRTAAVSERPSLGELFVLIQTIPRVAVLATSFDRERLRREAREMADQHRESGDRVLHRWFVRPVEMHLA